jgi:hypothetical protein
VLRPPSFTIDTVDGAPAPATSRALENNGDDGLGLDVICTITDGGESDADSAATHPVRAVLSAALRCTPDAGLVDRWKYAVYETLQQGYRRQLGAFRMALRACFEQLREENPDLLADIVRNQLFDRTLSAFFETYVAQKWQPTAATDPAPEQLELSRPRVTQFLRGALDWNNLSADLFQSGAHETAAVPPGRPVVSDLFPALALRSLIDATSASILLPAKPQSQRAMLYFFRLGEIWPLEPDLAPCLAEDISILSTIKAADSQGISCGTARAPITLTVPTAMIILGDDMSLAGVVS